MESIQHYTRTAKILHWLMAIIIIIAWCIGFYASLLPAKAPNLFATITLHKQFGSTILFLIAVRLAWRMLHAPPELPAGNSPMVIWASKAGHALLYVLMLGMAVSGWGYSSSAGYEIPVAGLFKLPPLVHKDAGLEAVFGTVHEWLGWSIGALVLGHVLMALKHHFVDRDGVLTRMVSWRS